MPVMGYVNPANATLLKKHLSSFFFEREQWRRGRGLRGRGKGQEKGGTVERI